MSNKRFDEIIRQRNQERLEKSREYYSNPENYKNTSPEFVKSIKAALEHDEFVVYAPQYFIILPVLEKAILRPIYNGQDLDDLLYFFDPDYVLEEMEHIQPPGGIAPDLSDYDPYEAARPFLVPMYAKYKAMTAAGMTTATDFNMMLLNQQIEEEILKNHDGWSLDAMSNTAWCESEDRQTDITDSLLYKVIIAALEALKKKGAESVIVKPITALTYPIDKINNEIWNLFEEDTQGQLTFKMEKKGSKKPLDLIYSIDFDELEAKGLKVSKRLTSYDKRCYIAAANLYNAGNAAFSVTQIFYAMGNDKKKNPSDNQLQKIRDSIEKMATARITIDNSQEAESYPKYGRFVCNDYLLPVRTMEHYNVQGIFTNGMISPLYEPPLIKFARQRDQITTIPLKLLQNPNVSKTDANLAIEDYLIERIRRAKRQNKQNTQRKSVTILLQTLYEKTGLLEKMQRRRAPETIKKYLDYYIECSEIQSYKISDGSIVIKF